MKILLINLDRSPQRLKRMEALLQGFELAFTRVPAVDGKLLSHEEMARWLGGEEKFYRLGPGEVGCFLSHRKCWEIAAAGPDEHTVVLEDDIHVGARAGEILSRSDWIPADADLVKVETTFRRTYLDKASINSISGRQIRRLRGEHTGTAGYIVSRGAAAKLLSLSEKFADPLDQFMFNPRSSSFFSFVTYQIEPALCVQDENLNRGGSEAALRSTLHGERRLNRRTGFAKLKREIERPFERLGNNLKGLAASLLTSRKWGGVPFE